MRAGYHRANDVRVTLGPGSDSVVAGTGLRVDARDGEPDTVECEGSLRDLRLDPGLDAANHCVPRVWLSSDDNARTLRVAPGARLPLRVGCASFRPCRARVWPRLGRRPLRPLALRIPPFGRRRAAVRIPARAAPGRRLLRFGIRSASPFRGAPPRRSRSYLWVRVGRRR